LVNNKADDLIADQTTKCCNELVDKIKHVGVLL